MVRRAALDGFVGLLSRRDVNGDGDAVKVMEECYGRAVELLLEDDDAVVRIGAIRAVSEWRQMLVDANCSEDKREHLDEIFIQLCSLVRDMDMKVRVEAFHALGRTRLASEGILLQTLSKKILGVRNVKAFHGKSGGQAAFSVSSAAGAYVHGLEDEFYEVRTACCDSLGSLTIFSIQFADGALNLLMDMLNDDTSIVRLQTLHTMYKMAAYDRLKVQERHMHMFLSLLVDVDPSIRSAARHLLRAMKLPDLEIFRSSINGLLANLETYPEDEADIFSVLFIIGKSHGASVVGFIKELVQEIKPSCQGELGLDQPRIAAFLVLSIAAPFSSKQLICDIPRQLFSYAVPLLGRISCSLGNALNRDVLSAYLGHCTEEAPLPDTALKMDDGLLLHAMEESNLDHNVKKGFVLEKCGTAQIEFRGNMSNPNVLLTFIEEYQRNLDMVHEQAIHVVKFVLRTATDTWPSVKFRYSEEVLRTVRACKQELEMIPKDSVGSASMLAFASLYLKLIKLLMRIWEHLLPRKIHVSGMGVLDILLEKLDMNLRSMRYGFQGLSKEEESHILELVLLSCVLRFSKVGICSGPTLNKLHATISLMDGLCEEGSPELSNFTKELKKCCHGRIHDDFYPLPVNKLVEAFTLEKISFSGRFKHVKAEVDIPGNDSENPLPFISGLPVGITFSITLYNVSSKDRLWLQMAMGSTIQHVFLDLHKFESSNEVKRCSVEVPFYRTAKAASFSLRTCVGLECQSEDIIYPRKGQAGPKHELTFLCKEKVIYLAVIGNNG